MNRDTDNWRARSRCRSDSDPDRWIDLPPLSVRGRVNQNYLDQVADLKAECLRCPVRAVCLLEAMRLDVKGVFGATDEYERASLREQYGIPEPPLYPPPENDTDERLHRQRFEVKRMARQGLTNIEIAQRLGVTRMTVSRFLADLPDEAAPTPAEGSGEHGYATIRTT